MQNRGGVFCAFCATGGGYCRCTLYCNMSMLLFRDRLKKEDEDYLLLLIYLFILLQTPYSDILHSRLNARPPGKQIAHRLLLNHICDSQSWSGVPEGEAAGPALWMGPHPEPHATCFPHRLWQFGFSQLLLYYKSDYKSRYSHRVLRVSPVSC